MLGAATVERASLRDAQTVSPNSRRILTTKVKV